MQIRHRSPDQIQIMGGCTPPPPPPNNLKWKIGTTLHADLVIDLIHTQSMHKNAPFHIDLQFIFFLGTSPSPSPPYMAIGFLTTSFYPHLLKTLHQIRLPIVDSVT